MGLLDFTKIKEYPIEGILAALGYRTDHIGSMYYSPFRDEKSPSFHLDKNKNVWYDFGGDCQGGTNLDLVAKVKKMTVYEAARFIENLSPYSATSICGNEQSKIKEEKSGIEVVDVRTNFSKYALISYSASRGIPVRILSRYCKEVYYKNNSSNKFYAIGFSNDSNGYVLRSSSFKGTTRSDITTITSGDHKERKSDKILVFEGFFNFLSYLVLHQITEPCSDVCVLNSTTNLRKGIDFISSHKEIEGWLDNDKTGRDTWQRLKAHIVDRNGIGANSFKDMSTIYSCANDLNEYLQSKGRRTMSRTL